MRLRLAAALVCAVSRPAAGNPYETFISIDSEEDLYDLNATGQIDDDSLATLTELYQRGVDLNKASREDLYDLPNLTYSEVDAIIEYRELAGWISDPIDLVINNVLNQEKLEAIAAFLVVSDASRSLFATDGWIRSQTRWTVEDEGVPPVSLQARVGTFQYLTVGVASTVSRQRLSDVRFDPTRDALSAEEADTTVHVPKIYAKWENDQWGVIAGTYRIGFGQRLTFDNTSLYTPNGFYLDDELYRDTSLTRECKESQGELPESPCDGLAGDIYVTPDYRWRDGLLGVALGAKRIPLGAGRVQAFGFASYSPRSIYQYEIYNRDTCDDPHDDDDEACAAPEVYHRQGDPLDPASRFSFHTLPNMYAEMTAGGNLAFSMGRRARIGVTGYGSSVNWLVDGADLDFQEWSRTPYGGPFGAVGVDAAYGVGMYDFFAEVSRSFDSMPEQDADTGVVDGGGGFAGIFRWVTTFQKYNELETSLRYYDEKFKNPYARPIAAADELEGARARDEMGIRLRYTARFKKRFSLRASTDLWRAPSDDTTDTLTTVRGDLDLTDQYQVGLWTLSQNKDISNNGLRPMDPDHCFEVSVEEDEDGEAIPCGGEKYQVTGRFKYTPLPRYSVTAQYQHELQTDARYDDQYRQDRSVALIGTARPTDDIRIRGRLRYLEEDISDDTYLEESVWAYADISYRIRAQDRLRVRYDIYKYLDDRESTMERVPSPEHWLWLEYESRF
jgi:hypothetical protein